MTRQNPGLWSRGGEEQIGYAQGGVGGECVCVCGGGGPGALPSTCLKLPQTAPLVRPDGFWQKNLKKQIKGALGKAD